MKKILCIAGLLSCLALAGCDKDYSIGLSGVQETSRMCLGGHVFFLAKSTSQGGVSLTQLLVNGPNGLTAAECVPGK